MVKLLYTKHYDAADPDWVWLFTNDKITEIVENFRTRVGLSRDIIYLHLFGNHVKSFVLENGFLCDFSNAILETLQGHIKWSALSQTSHRDWIREVILRIHNRIMSAATDEAKMALALSVEPKHEIQNFFL